MMSLRIVGKKSRRQKASISISGQYNRLLIYRKAYEVIRDWHGGDFDHLHFLLEDNKRGLLWLRPCKPADFGATPIRKSGNNRICSITPVLREMEWDREATSAFDVTLDAKNKAWKVDTRKPLALPPSESE